MGERGVAHADLRLPRRGVRIGAEGMVEAPSREARADLREQGKALGFDHLRQHGLAAPELEGEAGARAFRVARPGAVSAPFGDHVALAAIFDEDPFLLHVRIELECTLRRWNHAELQLVSEVLEIDPQLDAVAFLLAPRPRPHRGGKPALGGEGLRQGSLRCRREKLQRLVQIRLSAPVRADHDGQGRELEVDVAQRSVADHSQLSQHRSIPLAMANSVAQILMLLIALLHFYFLVLEMFLWRTRARKLFGMSAEKAEATAQLAQNQGLYNGFLAAGLLWAVFSRTDFAPRATFFLVCVALAGIFGAITVTRRIFYVQALPALVALVLLWIGAR